MVECRGLDWGEGLTDRFEDECCSVEGKGMWEWEAWVLWVGDESAALRVRLRRETYRHVAYYQFGFAHSHSLQFCH